MMRNMRRVGGLQQQLRKFSSKSAEEIEKKYIVPTYASGGIRTAEGLEFVSGKQCTLVDSNGKKYVDFGSGIAVTVLGHGDKEWTEAIKDQVGKLAHVSNLYHTRPALDLAEKLVGNSPGMGKIFFCNSGTEAMEGALKFARVYQNSKDGKHRNRFLAFKQSFHGRSLGALSVTYKPGIRLPFSPMLIPNVTHLDFNCIESLEKAIGPDVCALVLEPVQGEGGINPATKEFLKRARELCDEYGVALIFDEVQIGLGRQGNGKLWSYQEYDVVPDIITMAKPLANGLPIGGIMISEKMYSQVPESSWLGCHGSTFAANPVVTRAAGVVVDTLLSPGFLDDVKQNGTYFIRKLSEIGERLPNKIVAVRRPIGDAALYAGIQLPSASASAVVSKCLEKGVVILTAGDTGTVLRLCPPLIVTKEEIDITLKTLEEAIEEVVPDKKNIENNSTTESKVTLDINKESLNSDSEQDYLEKLNNSGHTILPKGFQVSKYPIEFFPEEIPETSEPAKMNLTMIVPSTPTKNYAALFTSNAFPGAPIIVGRKLVAENQPIGAVIINNKISNVHPKDGGVDDANKICNKVGEVLNLDQDAKVFPSSTGVIGWRLPVDKICENISNVKNELQNESILPAATGIMTTDTFPKARSCTIKDENGNILGRVTGIAKGAGMIEPDMATMLVYILTDIETEAETLDQMLRKAVNAPGSFNHISVDSDQSTSDTILLLSSNEMPKLQDENVLQQAITKMCEQLAQDVVRNGEGTEHVLKINVTGAPSEKLADGIAKSVANSPLCKTGIAGNDPNVGRIIAAIGSYIGKNIPSWSNLIQQNCEIYVGDLLVFQNAQFCIDEEKEILLGRHLSEVQLPTAQPFPAHYQTVDIDIHLQGKKSSTKGFSTTVFGADLTHSYVDVNAGYRS